MSMATAGRAGEDVRYSLTLWRRRRRGVDEGGPEAEEEESALGVYGEGDYGGTSWLRKVWVSRGVASEGDWCGPGGGF